MKRIKLLLFCTIFLLCAGCGPRKLPTAEHKLMLELSSSNWGCNDSSSDYWSGSDWSVYYDGQVETHDDYNLSGVMNEESYSLDESQMEELYGMLTTTFKLYSHDNNGCDGTGWYFTFYDKNGEVVHKFSGYIYNHRTLEKIVDIVNGQDVE